MSDPSAAPIVVGTDGSAPAERAVAWAADDAARRRRPLRIVHAIEQWVFDTPLGTPPGMRESLTEAGLRILAQAKTVAHERRPEVEVTTELIEKGSGAGLCDQSRRAFEIVLGHRGLGGFTSLLLGSTGLRVAGHAHGPVVIVRGDHTAAGGDVTVGVDLPEVSVETLEYAFDAAGTRSGRLTIVYAWDLPTPLVAGDYVIDETAIERSAQRSLTKTLEPWRKRYLDVEVIEKAVRGHPASALVDASEHADLLVIGSHGRSRLGLVHLGSVAHGVVHHAHCPVAVVRPRT
ncbi:universal stress protein [Actinomadura alba]|uniref:Universal stress protein n=1 Tax=Actinomadura alba TaxID=406431 RepID=A0ABR7LPB3_9ACTN|nr:universal stress protein [Actinomadura alba]MBC6466409.1 universal stress protein [Actinomadura alba]